MSYRDRDYNRNKDRDYKERDRDRDRDNKDNREQQQQQYRNRYKSSREEEEDEDREKEFKRNEDNKRLRELQTISDGNRKRRFDNRDRKNKEEEEDESKYEYGKKDYNDKKLKKDNQQNKEKPDFKPSGALLKDTSNSNTIENSSGGGGTENKVILKWSEPHECRLPDNDDRWIIYPFKEKQSLDPMYLHRKKSYLIGRDRTVVDIPTDHPSCSSQHAVFVYRQVKVKDEFGDFTEKVVKPYIIDLDSTNGTFLNGKKIDSSRYYELRSKDVLKFGLSTREYVLLLENLEI
eukprot:gene3099-3876_t